MTKKEFCKYVDHSLLKPNLTRNEIIDGLEFAKNNSCVAVCINPCNLDLARECLKGTDVKIGTVIGFPNGTSTTFSKVAEAIDAYARGAIELDMVIDIGALRNGEHDEVYNDIKSVVDAVPAATIKVILENAYLTEEEIAVGSQLVEKAGAHYVKTSTGFAATGATIKDIGIMKSNVKKAKVKAAGGITTLEEAIAFIEAGCDRIGISKTKAMLEGLKD